MMMKFMKKFFRYIVLGMLIGALTYLVILLILGSSTVTRSNIISILVMSAGIGLVSSIFDYELNYLLAMVIHFFVTFTMVVLMCNFNGWLPTLATNLFFSFFQFLMIYVIIWLGLYAFQMADIKRINQKLRKRNQQ